MMGPELLAFSAGLAWLGLHPFTTYPLSLAVLARVNPRPVAPDPSLPRAETVALCVCAYNEEAIIRAKVENMLAMREAVPGLELLIYVDAATDRTAQILAEYQDRIRVIVSPTRKGKTHGMNLLVRAANADFLVFSDANVFFASDAVPQLLSPFSDPSVGCVCGHLIYTGPNDSSTASTGSIYWRLEEAIKDLESRSGSVMGADGSIFAIRRALHRPPPPDIIDDMFVSLSILCEGHRVVRASNAIAYEASVSHPGEEFNRKIRIACQAFNVHRLLRPQLRRLGWLDQYKYVSHKLLRWLAAYMFGAALLVLLASLALMQGWVADVALLAGGGLLFAVGLIKPDGPIGKLMGVAYAFAATGLGILRSLRGERFQTWNPPSSARTR
jgi:cellulose synthase/poly-beta-1,6-N-acetylglucosamine synthase-like glycosyltransferase